MAGAAQRTCHCAVHRLFTVGGSAGPGDGLPVVLIVDDDADVASALAETLRPEFDARVLTSPRDALPMLDDREVVVLVADLRMLEMGGIELLAEARRRPRTAAC